MNIKWKRNNAKLHSKRLIFTALIILFTFFILPVSGENSLKMEDIKKQNSPYLWGEGEASEREEARKRALSELSGNISTSVSSRFESIIEETGSDYQEFMQSVVNTYTSAYFTNLRPFVDTLPNGDYKFLFYIHEDELEKEFNSRKKLVFNMHEMANEAMQSTNLARALQYYYYAMLIMNSVPERNIFYENKNLRTTIQHKIRDILENVRFLYESDVRPSPSMRTVLLRLEYQGKPVQLLDFVYIERGTEHKSRARDGRAACDLTGASVSYKDLDIEIEYRYASEVDCVPLVEELWQGIKKPVFNNKRKICFEEPVSIQPEIPAAEPEIIEQGNYELLLTQETDCPVQKVVYKETQHFLELIAEGKIEKIETTLPDDPFLQTKLSDMFRYNRPQLLDTTFPIELNPTWNGWEIRSIPIMCRYPALASQTMESLVLDFDKEGKLADFSFLVFQELHDTYVHSDTLADEEKLQRQTIVKFLEKYRSAFLNRDMPTLEKIFADEAIIIVGRELKPHETTKKYDIEKNEQEIEYLQLTKQQYLDRQKMIFLRQRDIHLGFNTFRILKKDRDTDIYGISMRQQYASSGYADEGYLFLLVDFTEQNPMIYVRSWQPGEWADEQMIKMSDFRVLK